MKIEVLRNPDLHVEHKQWSSELALWQDELKSFNKRLEEMVIRWTETNVLVQLEHYQNQFILHAGIIKTLQQHISIHEASMARQSKKAEDAIDRVHAKLHLEFRSQMETQREIFSELKKEFFDYLLKYK